MQRDFTAQSQLSLGTDQPGSQGEVHGANPAAIISALSTCIGRTPGHLPRHMVFAMISKCLVSDELLNQNPVVSWYNGPRTNKLTSTVTVTLPGVSHSGRNDSHLPRDDGIDDDNIRD